MNSRKLVQKVPSSYFEYDYTGSSATDKKKYVQYGNL